MANYCEVADIKPRLKIDETDVTYDTELADCIEEAQAFIDNELKNHTTVPLSTVPTLIKHVCANLAAGVFQRRRSPAPSVFSTIGKEQLNDYIQKTYFRGKMR